MRLRLSLMSLALLVAVVVGTGCDNPLMKTDADFNAEKTYRDAKLSDVLESPSSYKFQRVRFEVYFAKRGDLYRPFHTRFSKTSFMNMQVWDGSAHLWDRDVLGDELFTTMYVNRASTPIMETIESIDMFSRLDLLCLVSNDYKGQPWILVEGARPVKGVFLTRSKIEHIELGMRRSKEGEFKFAIQEFDMALAMGLDSESEVVVHEAIADACKGAGGELLERAQTHYKKAIQMATNEAESSLNRLKLGQVYISMGRYDDAITECKFAVENNPSLPEAHASLGVAYAQKSMYAEALMECHSALKLQDNNSSALRAMAVVNRLQGQHDEAVRYYGDAILQNPKDRELHEELAQLYKEMGRPDRQINQLAQLLVLNDSDEKGYFLYARALADNGQYDKAVGQLETAVRLKADYLEAFLLLAESHIALRQDELAEQYLVKAGNLDPENVEVSRTLYRIAIHSGDTAKACSVLEKLIEQNPCDADALYDLGVLYLQEGRVALASAKFAESISAYPNNALAHYQYGSTLLTLGDVKVALASLLKAVEIAPHNMAIRAEYARALAESGDVQQALGEFESVLSSNSDEGLELRVCANLAILYAESGTELTRAEGLARQFLVADPKSAPVQGALGWILLQRGDATNAAACLEIALNGMRDFDTLVRLATAYLRTGRAEEATSLLEEARSMVSSKDRETLAMIEELIDEAKLIISEPEATPSLEVGVE